MDAPDTKVPIVNQQDNEDLANFIVFNAFEIPTPNAAFDDPEILRVCGGPCHFTAAVPGYDSFHVDGDTQTESVGVFLNMNYDLTEEVRFTGGLRYSYTDRDFDDSGTRIDLFSEAFDVADVDLCVETLGFDPLVVPDDFTCFFLLRFFLVNLNPGLPAFDESNIAKNPTWARVGIYPDNLTVGPSGDTPDISSPIQQVIGPGTTGNNCNFYPATVPLLHQQPGRWPLLLHSHRVCHSGYPLLAELDAAGRDRTGHVGPRRLYVEWLHRRDGFPEQHPDDHAVSQRPEPDRQLGHFHGASPLNQRGDEDPRRRPQQPAATTLHGQVLSSA